MKHSFFTSGRLAAVPALLCAAALFIAAALPAFAAGMQEPAPGEGKGYSVVQPYGPNVYKETPRGEKSEAWGDGKYGPDHLRRISPTEHLPAPPQVEKTIPVGAGPQ